MYGKWAPQRERGKVQRVSEKKKGKCMWSNIFDGGKSWDMVVNGSWETVPTKLNIPLL